MTDLVARLKRARDMLAGHKMPDEANAVSAGIDRIETLEARLRSLHEALTPSAETKAAYIGEFSFSIEDTDDEWGLPITRQVDVPWTTIKEIMAAVLGRAALTPNNGGDE